MFGVFVVEELLHRLCRASNLRGHALDVDVKPLKSRHLERRRQIVVELHVRGEQLVIVLVCTFDGACMLP